MANATFSGYIPTNKGTCVIVIMTIIFVIFAHITIITAIIKRNALAEQRYYIVANISASDCCCCLVALIFFIRNRIDGHYSADISNLLLSKVVTASFRVSLLCTCLLSFDRYIAISRALRYQQIITTERILKGISCFWVLSLLLILVSYLKKGKSRILFDETTAM